MSADGREASACVCARCWSLDVTSRASRARIPRFIGLGWPARLQRARAACRGPIADSYQVAATRQAMGMPCLGLARDRAAHRSVVQNAAGSLRSALGASAGEREQADLVGPEERVLARCVPGLAGTPRPVPAAGQRGGWRWLLRPA